MSYADDVKRRPQIEGRPKSYEDLLLHPIESNPVSGKTSYENWEFDHGDTELSILISSIANLLNAISTIVQLKSRRRQIADKL